MYKGWFRRSFSVVFLVFVSSGAFASIGPFDTKVAFVSSRDGNNEIYTVNPNGSSPARLTNNPATDSHPSFSRTGKIAFVSNRDGDDEIYVMAANGADQERITFDSASDSQPTWSPDGNRIVFQSTRGGGFDIFIMNADGSGVTQLTTSPGFDTDPAFSPDGKKIAFVSNRDGNNEIYSMNANGSGQTRLTNNTLFEIRPDFSPSGGKIVFARNTPSEGSGFSQQVTIMDANGANQTVLTSLGANGSPTFSGDGNRIYFNSSRDLNTELYSMKVDGSNQVRMTNNVATDALPSVQSVFETETVGVYRPSTGQWVLSIDGPAADIIVNFGGQPGDLPVTGNWDGDSRTDIGVFRNGTFHLGLLKTNSVGATIVEPLSPIGFGQAGDLPVGGDWDGDGKDDIGVFRPGAAGKFLLRQPKVINVIFPITIFVTVTVNFGTTGDLPVAGDWDGNSIESPGVFRPGDPGTFLLTNSTAGTIDFNFTFGSQDQPLAGDWLASGRDGVGVFLEFSQLMILNPDLSSKGAIVVTFGQPGDKPVAGSWSP